MIGRVPEAEQILEPAGYVDDGTVMGEGFEAVSAVVGTVSGVADAAEGCVGDTGMSHQIVDGDAPGCGL